MATGAGRGHTPAAPTGGTGTPTETPPPPPGHRHPHGDTGILSWIRAPGPYRRRRDPRGSSALSGEHGGPTVAQTHGHPHTGQLRAPCAKFGVSRSPPSPGAQTSAELLGGGCRGGGHPVRDHPRDGLGAWGSAELRARFCRGGNPWRSRHHARQPVLALKGFWSGL